MSAQAREKRIVTVPPSGTKTLGGALGGSGPTPELVIILDDRTVVWESQAQPLVLQARLHQLTP